MVIQRNDEEYSGIIRRIWKGEYDSCVSFLRRDSDIVECP